MKKLEAVQKRIAKVVGVAAVGVFVFAFTSLAQTTLTLTGVGDGVTLGNVYVDPYTATVGTTTGVAVICDDWSNNTYMSESWTANATNGAAVNGATPSPMFGNTAAAQTLYNEVTWLGAQLLALPTDGSASAAQTEISFAIWDLTYGANGTTEETPAPLAYLAANLAGGTANSIYQGVLSDIAAALGEGNYNSSGWEILTPTGPGTPTTDGVPQEFLVYTPEPATFGMLFMGLAGVLLLGWRQRKIGSTLAA